MMTHLNLIDSFTDAAGVQSFDGLLQFGQTVTIHVQNLNKNTHTHTQINNYIAINEKPY